MRLSTAQISIVVERDLSCKKPIALIGNVLLENPDNAFKTLH